MRKALGGRKTWVWCSDRNDRRHVGGFLKMGPKRASKKSVPFIGRATVVQTLYPWLVPVLSLSWRALFFDMVWN